MIQLRVITTDSIRYRYVINLYNFIGTLTLLCNIHVHVHARAYIAYIHVHIDTSVKEAEFEFEQIPNRDVNKECH